MGINKKRSVFILIMALCICLLLAACGDKSAASAEVEPSAAPQPVTTTGESAVVPATPQSTAVPTPAATATPELPVTVILRYQGQEATSLSFMAPSVFQLEAVVSSGATGGTWTSSDASAASVDQNGVVTCWKVGSPRITYTIGSASSSCTLNITEPKVAIYFGGAPKTDITLNSIWGFEITLTAVVTPAGSEVTWSSDDASIASVDANGKVTAHKMGSTLIHAKCGTADASCWIRVMENPPAAYMAAVPDDTTPRIVITCWGVPNNDLTMHPGEALDMGYLLYNIDPSTAVVKWSISDPEYASVDANGHLFALKPTWGALPGRNYTTLTATCGTASYECIVFIRNN